MIKVIAMSHHMSEKQATLTAEVISQVKVLGDTVSSPQNEAKEYLKSLAQRDHINVEEVMQKYKSWQQQVDTEFERSVHVIAELHASLSLEQRQKLMKTYNEMQSN